MKIITVLGARPQFIKAASLSRKLRQVHQEIIINTGQHYDSKMSNLFFDELGLPKPEFNLGVGSDSHGAQTAKMLTGIEDILINEKPDLVLLYGDTNSTLAGCLAASKLNIKTAHIEAGLRFGLKDMPEEQNRIVTDHLATINFAPTSAAMTHLANEGLHNGVNVGDIMQDGVNYYSQLATNTRKGDFYLATIHRPENTDDPEILSNIFKQLEKLPHKVIFPVHPRIQNKVYASENIEFIDPVGYLEMMSLLKGCVKVISDSGGLHKEAFMLKKPCVVVLRTTAWEETLAGNCNVLARPHEILEKTLNTSIDYSQYEQNYYGDGTTAEKIIEVLSKC